MSEQPEVPNNDDDDAPPRVHPQDPAEGVDPDASDDDEAPPRVHPQDPAEG